MVFDLDRSNALLNEIGLDKRDANGFCIGLDGRTISLIIELYNVKGHDMNTVEVMRSNWENWAPKPRSNPKSRPSTSSGSPKTAST